MPYVKSIPIHHSPKSTIKYILNPSKTENLLLTSSLNCTTNVEFANDEFKLCFEAYSKGVPFNEAEYINNHSVTDIDKKKKKIKAFHFVQSFKANDVTPDVAHQIAQEWAKEVFGDNRQVIIATHVDKEHIHNHFVVNPYSFTGEKFNSNKTTLERARKISDEICLQHNVSIITERKGRGVSRKEWDERQRGTSWKEKIKLTIDKLIYTVNSSDELFKELEKLGYKIKVGKYISITAPGMERALRIDGKRGFGEEYTITSLTERIINKGNMKFQADEKYKGIQRPVAAMLKRTADMISKGEKTPFKYNRKKPYSIENDYHVNDLANSLRVLTRDNISSEEELKRKLAEYEKQYQDTKYAIDKLNSLQASFRAVIQNAEYYFSKRDKDKSELTPAEQVKLSIAENTIKQFSIKSPDAIGTLQEQYSANVLKVEELNAVFADAAAKYKDYTNTMKTYTSIKDNSYLAKISRAREQLQQDTNLQPPKEKS